MADSNVYMAKLAEQALLHAPAQGARKGIDISRVRGDIRKSRQFTPCSDFPRAQWNQAERYEEMVEYMKQVSQAASTDLSLEERNLLSVAYKNVVGARRASLRIIGSIENKEEGKGDSEKVNLISSYKGKVEQELNNICMDILTLLDSSLIKSDLPAEPAVFYQKVSSPFHPAPATRAHSPDPGGGLLEWERTAARAPKC